MTATAVDSPFTSYSDTTPQKRVITDVISLIDPSDAPFIEKIGGLDGAAGKFRFANEPSTTVEWLEDNLPSLTSTLQTATIGTDATSATVADASWFQPGHIIEIDSQTFWVSAVNTTTNVLTMTPLGGTAASHATGTTITIVGMARLEGDDSDASPYTDRSTGSNYTDIFHAEIKASRTQAKISQWGIGNEFDYQASKAVPGLMRQIEQQVLKNDTKSLGSATTPRVMGGLPAFVTANATSGASLTKAKFQVPVRYIYEDGGSSELVAPVSPTNFEKIGGFYETSAFLRIKREETVVGMPPVDRIQTPFGTVELILDRWAKDSTIYIVDPKHAGMLTYDAFRQEPLAKDGDYEKGEIVGEFTFCLRQANAHGSLTSVS
ncbi:MAG TPA: DUF5309 family protein [Candidatus Cloacimonadota bacterium]|nr:DUF5309 family protein [Candidatus Cloacimonadota bacterium]